jgi:hypothetical protein
VERTAARREKERRLNIASHEESRREVTESGERATNVHVPAERERVVVYAPMDVVL